MPPAHSDGYRMSALALPSHSQDVVLQLYDLLYIIDPARLKLQEEPRVRAKLASVRDGLAEIAVHCEPLPHLADAFHDTVQILRDDTPTLPTTGPGTRRAWSRFRKRLMQSYTELSKHLAMEDVQVPHIRATNWGRSIFHVCTAIVATSILLGLQNHKDWLVWITVGLNATTWTLEALRKLVPGLNKVLMTFFKPIAHPHEHHKINSATWYGLALLILALSRHTPSSMMGLVVLGLADPMAGIVGRRYGQTKLVNNRSLEGTLTFFGVGLFIAVFMVQVLGFIPGWKAWPVAAVGAAAGALAELYSKRLDDNLTIPLAVAGASWGMMALMGL